MSGPRRAQTMVNKEEKMHQKMNLETNGNMYAEKSEQREKKQTIENEMEEDTNGGKHQQHQQPLPMPHRDRDHDHQIPMALQQDSAHGKA